MCSEKAFEADWRTLLRPKVTRYLLSLIWSPTFIISLFLTRILIGIDAVDFLRHCCQPISEAWLAFLLLSDFGNQ